MSYTEEETAKIIAQYEANPNRETVDEIAANIGKSARSVIAKLSSAGVYQTPVRLTKTGDAIIKKETMVEHMEQWLQIKMPTLAKTGKEDLKKLYHAIAEHLEVDLKEYE